LQLPFLFLLDQVEKINLLKHSTHVGQREAIHGVGSSSSAMNTCAFTAAALFGAGSW
jgi:hypothetical protein